MWGISSVLRGKIAFKWGIFIIVSGKIAFKWGDVSRGTNNRTVTRNIDL
jgi:hypothetical protein